MASGARSEGSTLVLGASGFLGAHVVAAALRAAPALVHAASRVPSPIPGAQHWELDALRAGALEELCARLRPARVIVCTALARIDECEAYPGLARALNVEFPERCARWCARSGARLVHVSTDLVFGARAPGASDVTGRAGFREEDPVGPLSEYGRSKARGEDAVLAAHPAALVVRLPLMYGDSHGTGRGASDSVLRAVAAGERPLLFEDEWRTPLEVSNAARALVEVAHDALAGRLHVAGSERISRHALGVLALVAAGQRPEQARAAVRAGTRREAGQELARPADVSLDAGRARARLATPLLAPSEGFALARD